MSVLHVAGKAGRNKQPCARCGVVLINHGQRKAGAPKRDASWFHEPGTEITEAAPGVFTVGGRRGAKECTR